MSATDAVVEDAEDAEDVPGPSKPLRLAPRPRSASPVGLGVVSLRSPSLEGQGGRPLRTHESGPSSIESTSSWEWPSQNEIVQIAATLFGLVRSRTIRTDIEIGVRVKWATG